jgi:exopolysaccharide biosynthesis protein
MMSGLGLVAAVTLGERVNAWIDDLLAVANRLEELPLLVLIPVVALAAAGIVMAVGRLRGKRWGRGAVAVMVAAGALVGLVVVDRKIGHLEDRLNVVRAKAAADTTALLARLAERETAPVPVAAAATTAPAAVAASAPATAPAVLAVKRREALFVDVAAVAKALSPTFGEATIKPLVYDAATDVYQVHTSTPFSQVWLAVVDLTNPKVKLELQADFSIKTLTSAFAKDRGCTVAINGEAGNSPEQYSGLGPWSGYMVIDGKKVRDETPNNPRPFLAFDAENRGTFRAMAAADRRLPAEMPTVIWGRLDALIDGVVQTQNERNRQPRTAMAIDKAGGRLYLMVVDGRQPRRSNGFSRAEVGYFLKAFGAENGMLCDEGGSSCMYVEGFGGIVNVPSDFNGQERVTYTHFGVRVGK